MASTFDILRNPFILLGIAPSVSVSEIAEAYDDAIADANQLQADLAAARQAILSPPLRLAAEVSCLLDMPKQDWRSVLTALKSSQSLPALRKAFAKVAPLSRANLLAHLSAHAASDASTMVAWVEAQSKIDPDLICRELARLRSLARVAPPDGSAVRAALDQLRESHARALFEGFLTPADAIEPATICAREAIAVGDQKHVDTLDTLLRAYSAFIAQELALRRERVKVTASDLQSQPRDSNLAVFLDALNFWNLAAQPLQAFEFYKGRDEPTAQDVFWEVREVAIDLANRLSRFDFALSITEACKRIFEKLPRAASQLAEDHDGLKQRIATQPVEPLAEALREIERDLASIALDLRRGGFGSAAVGQAKHLRDVFVTAVRSSSDSKVNQLPWVLLRSLAVKLNNEADASDGALALIRGLFTLARDYPVSDETLAMLRVDERAAERNKLEKELIDHINAQRFGPAVKIADDLLRDCKNADERATLEKVRSDIRGHQRRKYGRWAFWAAAAVVAIFIANADRKPSVSTSRPNTEYRPPGPEPRTPPPPSRDYSERKPSVGRENVLDEANLRYCLFQGVRLDAAKRLVSGDFEVDEFNKLVEDYNARCGSYRYRNQDKSAVEAELTLQRPRLEADAERIVQSWRMTRRPPAQWTPPPPARDVLTTPPQQPPSATGPVPSTVSEPQQIDLLRLADAIRVQSRLAELGYLKGSVDGAWGAQSRAALRAFRAASSLPPSDVWDVSTAEQLFSIAAVRATGPRKPIQPLPDFIFQPPAGATTNPLNKEDAVRIHGKLRELGFYQAKNNVLWSPASRAALRDFKAGADLPADDEWDAVTEQKLFSAESPETIFDTSIAGLWTTDLAACPGSGISSDSTLMRITRKRAEAGGAGCDFLSTKVENNTWSMKAQCRADDKSWIANIALSRQGDQLKWASERGTTTYFRCGS
jgi:peptidoglycan hydrolase-like protein with peptidoglycan-binding domain